MTPSGDPRGSHPPSPFRRRRALEGALGLVLAAGLALHAGPQARAEVVGAVSEVKAIAYGTPESGERKPKFHDDAVTLNEVLETVPDGGLVVNMADDTTLTLGGGAQIIVDEMVYDPKTHGGSAVVNLVAGAFLFVSGKIAKESVTINTPTATIGIRGTKLAITIEPSGETSVAVIEGGARVTSKRTRRAFDAEIGNSVMVDSAGTVSPPVTRMVMSGDSYVDTKATLAVQTSLTLAQRTLSLVETTTLTRAETLITKVEETALVTLTKAQDDGAALVLAAEADGQRLVTLATQQAQALVAEAPDPAAREQARVQGQQLVDEAQRRAQAGIREAQQTARQGVQTVRQEGQHRIQTARKEAGQMVQDARAQAQARLASLQKVAAAVRSGVDAAGKRRAAALQQRQARTLPVKAGVARALPKVTPEAPRQTFKVKQANIVNRKLDKPAAGPAPVLNRADIVPTTKDLVGGRTPTLPRQALEGKLKEDPTVRRPVVAPTRPVIKPTVKPRVVTPKVKQAVKKRVIQRTVPRTQILNTR